jgi:hypothetical protein
VKDLLKDKGVFDVGAYHGESLMIQEKNTSWKGMEFHIQFSVELTFRRSSGDSDCLYFFSAIKAAPGLHGAGNRRRRPRIISGAMHP